MGLTRQLAEFRVRTGYEDLPERVVLRAKQVDNICFVAGGFIPEEDVPELKAMGVQEVFGVGSQVKEIIDFFL